MSIATDTLIADAIATLKESFPELSVELFPARPEDYRLNHPAGALLIAYPGSSSGAPQMMGRVEQQRTVRLGLTLVLRQLWGPDGAPAMLDRLRASLVGWRPSSECEPLYAISDRFLHQDAGLWWYAAEFACVTRQILPIR